MGVSIEDLSTKGLNLTERVQLTALDTDSAGSTVTIAAAASGDTLASGSYVLGSNKQVLLNGDAVGTYTSSAITIDGKKFTASLGQLMEGASFQAGSTGVVSTFAVKNAATFKGQVEAGAYSLSLLHI